MRRLVASLILIAWPVQTVSALTPMPDHHTHRIFSENLRYYAHVSANGRTIIKQVQKWWFDKTLWSTPNYFEWAHLADDGSFIETSWHVISKPYKKDTDCIWIYQNNGALETIKLDLLVVDLRRMKDVMGMGSWGGVVGFEGNWIRVETCENRILLINAKTKAVRLVGFKK